MMETRVARLAAQHIEEMVAWVQVVHSVFARVLTPETATDLAQAWVDRIDDQWHVGEDPILRDMLRALRRYKVPCPDNPSAEEIRQRYNLFRGIADG